MNYKQKAIELLGEKETNAEDLGNGDFVIARNKYRNQIYFKAVEVVVGLLEEMELKIGVWLCPKCGKGCPSGKLCINCMEKRIQEIKEEFDKQVLQTTSINTELQSAKERVEELEKEASRIRLGMGDDYGDDPVAVINTLKTKYQELKDKLTVENLVKAQIKIGYGYPLGYYQVQKLTEIAEALIKELKSTNDVKEVYGHK